MSDKIYEVPAEWKQRGTINEAKYKEMYEASIADPDGFWAEQAKRIDWMKPFARVKNTSFAPGNVSIKWFEDGTLNVAYNCIDRHLAKRADQTAIIWEGDDPKDDKHDHLSASCTTRSAGWPTSCASRGVEKGDRVTIYMPMIPEAAYAMLACARIGAVHSVVFGGFSPESLAGRIEDCDSRTSSSPPTRACAAAARCRSRPTSTRRSRKAGGVEHVIVVRRTGARGRHGCRAATSGTTRPPQVVTAECPCEEMNAEDPLFILYTSGSTGKPKGVLHTTGGYLVYAAMTHQYVFDYHDGDIYWCTADVGWVTGHSYIVYGPLANGATTLMFEGVPNYPDDVALLGGDRQAQGQHLLHRADRDPRADAARATAPVKKTSRKSLRLLGIGRRADQSRGLGVVSPRRRRRPLPDRRHLVADRDRRHPDHAAARRDRAQARLGDAAVLRRAARRSSMPRARCWKAPPTAISCIADSWPGQMRTVYGDHQRFIDTYFTTYPGKYFTGDGCRRDEDGYYWITGRVDDVINVSGHRIGTAEVESALVAHPKVSEAAVVGYPHDIKGQGIYAYVTLMAGEQPSEELRKELVALGAQGDRPDRLARPHPVRARPAEDALRQDHAPHPAQDRRGRVRQSRRHLDARRSGRGRRPGEQPAEQEIGLRGGSSKNSPATYSRMPRLSMWTARVPRRIDIALNDTCGAS